MSLQKLETEKDYLQKTLAGKTKATITSSIALRKELAEIDEKIAEKWTRLEPADRVYLARKKDRPGVKAYIDALFTDFFEQKGDRLHGEDASILGGVALYKGRPVTVVGHHKGQTLEENIACRFGMPQPEGYRKALRLMQQAEKFNRPIITFVDTPGAYPGIEAEEGGQGTAIAQCIAQMSSLRVPIISVVTGEGGSGGALALSVANFLFMLENSVYAILSPEGFSSILWKDASRAEEACELMKLTADDLFQNGIADDIIAEGIGGASKNPQKVFSAVGQKLDDTLALMDTWNTEELLLHRHEKFRKIGL